MDEYTAKIFEFLDKIPVGKICTVDRICKADNREQFIAAVKLYIDSFPFGAGVTFITEKYERFRRNDIPEAALKALNNQ